MPPDCTTCLQTLRKPSVQFLATVRAFWLFSTRRTRSRYAVFPKTGRLLTASLRSRARNFFLSQAQNFSTGLRSGLRGGTCHMLMRSPNPPTLIRKCFDFWWHPEFLSTEKRNTSQPRQYKKKLRMTFIGHRRVTPRPAANNNECFENEASHCECPRVLELFRDAPPQTL